MKDKIVEILKEKGVRSKNERTGNVFYTIFEKDLDAIAHLYSAGEEVSEDELQQDFRDWLGWNDQDPPYQDDPDYYTYSWGMNVWCNAYKAYKSITHPTVSEDEIMQLFIDSEEEFYRPEVERIVKAIKELLNR